MQVQYVISYLPLERRPHDPRHGDRGDGEAISPDCAIALLDGVSPSRESPE
jgi:hypothetical protein